MFDYKLQFYQFNFFSAKVSDRWIIMSDLSIITFNNVRLIYNHISQQVDDIINKAHLTGLSNLEFQSKVRINTVDYMLVYGITIIVIYLLQQRRMFTFFAIHIFVSCSTVSECPYNIRYSDDSYYILLK